MGVWFLSLHPRVIAVRIGHETGLRSVSTKYADDGGLETTTVTKYAIYDEYLTRPDTGVETVELSCRICGEQLKFRLASPSASRRKRLVYLGIAVVLLGQSIIYYSTGVGQGLLAFVGLLAGICLAAFALTSEFNRAIIGPNGRRGEKYQLGLHKLFKDKGNISSPLMPKLPWD